jgi:hypothetical protein
MTHLTFNELERAAYITGNIDIAKIYADIEDNQGIIETMETEIDDLKSDSLAEWEINNGPVKEYYDFFHECFDRLNPHYPCPEVTSDYDKSIIFEAITKGDIEDNIIVNHIEA